MKVGQMFNKLTDVAFTILASIKASIKISILLRMSARQKTFSVQAFVQC
ncbi:MAG: hypothetical protein N2748_02495 [candidate division WOR-3 bacterium]|nr:hypothetical protein [candidate division WOR-3 bacterium]